MAIAEKMVCSLALAVSVLQAQAQTPTGNLASALVRVNVVGLDSSGQPVADLNIEDFKAQDQGKPQNIAFFRRSQGAEPAAPLGPNEVSNRAGGVVPHSTVILFDLLNESQSDRLGVWHSLGRSLQQLESSDSLYLYLLTLEGTLSPIHPTGGKSGDDRTWTQQAEKLLDAAMKSASHARPAGLGDEDVVKKTYVALEALSNQLAAIPGRRDIVWITNGVPNVWNPKTSCNGDWIDCALYVPHLSVTLDRNSVAVNPLSYSSSPNANVARDMEEMAGLTGGRAYFRQDIRSVVAQVAKDAASGYLLAYDPSADNWDNKFHRVRLTCARKGIKLQAKQRYYAYPDQRPVAARQHAALAAAYQNPADACDIGLRATVSPATEAQKAVHLEIRVSPDDILLREQGDNFDGALTLLTADLGAAGPLAEPTVSNFSLHLTRAQRDAGIKDGIPIALDHPINDSIQKVRILALDQGTNAVGALTIPLGAAGTGH